MMKKTQIKKFETLVQQAISDAKQLGATQSVAKVTQSGGLSVSVRKGHLETVEQNQDRSLDITVYKGKRRGSASTSSLTPEAVLQTVKAAWDIANYTAEDEFAGLPDETELATEFPDLKLCKVWNVDTEAATQIALQTESAALKYSKLISNSEGASVSSHTGGLVMANSLGFMAHKDFSRHGISVSVIAGKGNNMHRDYWQSDNRYANRLGAPEQIGEYAAQRALSRLSAKRIATGRYPILFEAPLAVGLMGALTQAINGDALYRKTSFLLDSLGRPVLADHIGITEDPYIIGGMGSAVFDSEGVQTRGRELVQNGILNGYLLSTYTARKLGMKTTGNAGGSHNLRLHSSLSKKQDDFQAMLKKLGTGLLVTELMGQGVNYVTGDYSRGAFAYWVENGEIQHAVQEITIAGNLKDMFKQIVAVGSDAYTLGSKTSGSILIEQMAVAGL